MEEINYIRDSSNETIIFNNKYIDDVEDELDLVEELNSKECQIMYTGYKVQNMLFYFCSCDPDQKHPMCSDCYTNCHADHDKSNEISYEMSTVCSCGINYHRITDSKENDNFFNKQCLFMEWSRVSGTYINFVSKENNKTFCLFCANFCQNIENLTKNINPYSIDCSCSSLNHQDAKSSLKKLTQIGILKSIQLNNFTFTHMINLITLSKNSFDNIFKNLVEYLLKLQNDMEKEGFNLDSNIGYSLAMKSLETLFILSESTKRFFYFSENFDALLDKKFVFALLEKKIDYRGEERNLWHLKDFIFGLYINFIFYRDFENVPFLSFKDIENLHPLQRLIFIKTVQSSTHHINSRYFKSSNFQPLEQIINIIEKINSIKEKNEIAYDILHKCYKICRVYASYNCLSSELGRFCSINDDVISSTEADKKIIPHYLLISQMKVMIQMVKSISYCVYYHNDEVLEKILKSTDKDVGKLAFFHSNSYDAKLIYKNCINILNYVRNCRKSLDVESTKIIRKNIYRNTVLDFKIFESKKDTLKLDEQAKSIEKFLKKILIYATNITSIVINNPENYMIGLRRLLQKDMEIYMNYMTLACADENEKEFFKNIVELRINLEDKFSGFFQFKIGETDLMAEVIKSLKSYKEILQNFIPERILPYSYLKAAENKFSTKNLNCLNKNLYYLISKDPSEKKELFKSENNKTKKKNKNKENENSKTSISKIEIFKYQILTSKGLFQFTIIKALKILLKAKENFNNKEGEINTFRSNLLTSDEFFLQEIMSFLYFFVEDNPDNCIIMLSEDLLETFCLLDIENLYYFIDFLQHVLLILYSHEVYINSQSSLLRTIKVLLNKISGNIKYLHLLEKLIKIVKIFTELPCINQELKFSKLRSIMKIFFAKNPILLEFKYYLVSLDSLKNLKLIKLESNNSLEIKNNFRYFNDQNRGKNKKISISENYLTNIMNLESFDDNEKNKELTEVIQETNINDFEIKGYNIDLLFTIFYKFLKIINYIFDGNATLNENSFLSTILKSKEIPCILRKKNIALQLRTEILKFFRMTDIDVIIDPKNLENYRSIFVNNIIVQDDSRLLEDQQIYKIFNNLLAVNENCLKIALESAVIKYELKFFDKIVEESKCKEKENILIYFENGIILPLIVFINKFMSIIFNQTGYQYLKFYEIVVYFLKLKKFLIENIPKQYESEKTNNKFFTKLVNNLKMKKNKFSLINKNFSADDLVKLNTDIEYMCNPNFDILDYKLVHNFFEEHIKGFIKQPPLNSIIRIFDKRELNHSIEDLKKIDLELKQAGYLKLPFEKKIYETILNYENDKNKFSESSFIQNLSESNHIFDSNYRAIILKTTFFLVNDKKLSEKYLKQNFWNLFKLLQNDTNPTQTEIYSLYLDNHLNINFEHIVDIFLQNFLSIIFASCNPSTAIVNEDYFIAMTIIKIMKYLCEDHNYNFQTIFFSELKFDCVNVFDFLQPEKKESVSFKKVHSKVSLFDLLLGVVGKIIVLAQWEKINFENFGKIEENNSEQNSSEYFYDIFFAIIELLIEMVQGTTSENLEGISVIVGSSFFSFLQNIKSILLKDNNDSPIVYKVRKDLIEFIVSFLEEKSTPKKMINLISSIFNPFSIFDCIVNTLKKIYIKNNSKNKWKIKDYEEVVFDYKKCENFVRTYFSDKNFCETPEFILANRLYQYVKLLSSQFKYEDAVSIINSIKFYQENDIVKYFEKKKNLKHNKLIFNENVNDELLLDDSYLQNYFAVKFFEKITRTVYVKNEKSDIMVLFTVNPSINFLSSNTKTEFYENVNRDTEYSKKLSLIETCDYFYDEIVYNSRQMNNKFYHMLNKINYFYAEAGLFILTFIINLYLLRSLNRAEVDSGFIHIFPVVQALGSIQLLLNGIFLLAWFVSKFPLYYIVEKKKFCIKIGKLNKELSIMQNIKIILWYTILKKSQTNGFIWNIIFSALAISSPSYTFLFSIQLLSIINLSVTLHNIVNAVTLRYKQLLSTSMFMVIMLYFFSCLAFYFLSQDFITSEHEGSEENKCSSLLSCFLTHLDHGLRTDGGIGEILRAISFYSDPGYFIARFFYEITFFMVMIVILLNIVFGMIIDTFAELREKTKQIFNDKENICYICGGKRDYLEKNSISFDEHVKVDHSIWTYAEYIIGLKFMDPQEANAINSYVIGMIDDKKISWLPSIEEEDTAE